MDFFLKVDLIGFFRELNVRKFGKFSLIIFTTKKEDFRPETRISSETTIPGISSSTGSGFRSGSAGSVPYQYQFLVPSSVAGFPVFARLRAPAQFLSTIHLG